jgi:histidine triad (HIT) family protein
MSDCIFCKIAAGEIPSTLVYEDELVVAFEDINPLAPVHVLVVPRAHVATLNDTQDAPDGLADAVMRAAREIARQRGVSGSGYRLVANCNAEGGQEVFHLHFHVLGGRQMGRMG